MIRTFKNAALKRYWNTGRAKGLPAQDIKKIERILTSLSAATAPEDMALPQYKIPSIEGR